MSVDDPDLQRAELLLASGLPGSSRMAAWLARVALESGVVRRLEKLGHDTRGASMRSRLMCLHILDGERSPDADFAWSRLSGACHQHAFELAPTAGEVRSLIEHVRRVVRD